MKPNFSPTGGIGSTWKDPKTGQVYRYTAQGWVAESKDIKKETSQTKTFEIKPDEKDLVEKLKTGGSNQEQIDKGLTERRRVLSNLGQVETTEVVEEAPAEKPNITNPFEGMNKQQMLRDAFNKGVTSTTELKKLEDLYDLLSGDEDTDVDKANQFIEDNPDASSEELFVAIKENTKLDVSTINALLKSAGAVSKEDIGDLTEDELKKIAIGLVKENTGLFTKAKEGKDNAIRDVEADTSLTNAQKTKVKELIEEEYPEGRTIGQRLFPFGK